MPRRRYILSLTLLASTLLGCSSTLHTLPAPPPRSEWVDNASEPDAESRAQNLRYLEARAALLELFSALNLGSADKVAPLLAQASIDWLTDYGSRSLQEAIRPISDEEIEAAKSSGQPVNRIDPIRDLTAPDLSKLVDAVPGLDENEDTNRVEIFALLEDGSYRRITMIRENGNWKLLRTSPPEDEKPNR